MVVIVGSLKLVIIIVSKLEIFITLLQENNEQADNSKKIKIFMRSLCIYLIDTYEAIYEQSSGLYSDR